MTREIKNARIRSTMLGVEDHGIMTCYLHLDYDGGGQGFGGWAFDTYDTERKERIGHPFGISFILKTLSVVEVDSWERLKGKHIRVDAENTKVHGIGNIIKDVWFYPEKDLAFLREKEANKRD